MQQAARNQQVEYPKMHKGFTLLEFIIVIAIGIIILGALSYIFIAQYNLYGTQEIAIDLENSLTSILRNIQKFAAGATSIVASRDFGGTIHATDADTVIFEIPSVDSVGNILSSKDYVVFYLDSTDLKKFYVQLDAAPESSRKDIIKLLTSLTDRLQFRYNKSDPVQAETVEIFVSMKKVRKDNAEEASGSTRVFLRNK